jgi:hypothetical protein
LKLQYTVNNEYSKKKKWRERLHCLDGQTYPLFTIRVLEFELQLSYTVVNAVDLLQFLLMVQNMPVVTASQTNDCLGLSPICHQCRLVFPMAVSCSCPRHVSEWNLPLIWKLLWFEQAYQES